MKTISVIIPNYNDIRIETAVFAVRQQTKPSELIIVDGGSTDPQVIGYYNRHKADCLIMEKDRGVFDALNKGIGCASGDVIFLQGADDVLSDKEIFDNVLKVFDDNPSLDGVCIGCEYVDQDQTVVRSWYPKTISSKNIKLGFLPPHFSLFLKKDIYDLVGKFRISERYRDLACDTMWLIDLAIMKNDLQIKMLPAHHLKMSQGGISTGSFRTILKQCWVVHNFAKERSEELRWWFFVSPLKTLSKIGQIKSLRRWVTR